jgi:hypothetical protein
MRCAKGSTGLWWTCRYTTTKSEEQLESTCVTFSSCK